MRASQQVWIFKSRLQHDGRSRNLLDQFTASPRSGDGLSHALCLRFRTAVCCPSIPPLRTRERSVAWSNRPVAVLDGPDSLPRVFACNERAQLAGIEPGITKAQAAQCPDIILRKRMPKQEQAAQDALLDCGAEFSPKVESTSQGIVSLDIEGTERIFGPPQKLIRTLAHHAARVGLEVNVAAATNRDTALLAARGFTGTR